jgi:hypothetical protein
MKLLTRRPAEYVAVLAVAAGVILAASSPASAAPPNKGIALQATGLIPASPLVVSNFPGTSPNHSGSLNLPPLLTTGVADTAAGPTSASATVSNLSVFLPTLASVTTGTLTSSCSYSTTTGRVTGSGDIENGRVVLFGTPIALDPHPAPNTALNLAGIGTLTLNRQTTAPDGTLTVDALSVQLLGGVENVSVATSVCNAAALS